MEFRAQQRLAVPAHVAFDLLADLRTQPHWSRAPMHPELLSGEPIGPDSRFRAVHNGRDYEAVITTYRRAEHLAIDVRGNHLQVQGEFRFLPADGGSLLEAVVDIGAKGPARLVLPTFRGTIAAELPKEAASFARFCDTWAAR
jgi:hypothetical protein